MSGDDAGYDCLGCLQDAHQRGEVDDDLYFDIVDAWREQAQVQEPCPACGKTAYASLYEPTVAHCPSCGVYSWQSEHGGDYVPVFQGAAHRGREVGNHGSA